MPVLTTLLMGAKSEKEQLEAEVKGKTDVEHQPIAQS